MERGEAVPVVTAPARNEGREGREWTLYVCPECGSLALAGGRNGKVVAHCHHHTEDWGAPIRKVRRAPVVVVPKVERDEAVQELREALAYEARVVEAQTLDVAALGKGRRRHLEQAVERMRAVALGAEHPKRGSRGFESELRALASRPAAGQETGG